MARDAVKNAFADEGLERDDPSSIKLDSIYIYLLRGSGEEPFCGPK